MNWSKAKTILIVFLLCTCAILSYSLISSREKSMTINPETVEHTVNLLNSRGVVVSRELVSRKITTEKIYNVENVITDYETFANVVFPDCTSGENDFYYASDGSAAINFYADRFKITFENGYPTSHKLKSPSDKVRAYLQTIGIDVGDSQVIVSNDAEGIFTVSFTNTLGNLPFFDCTIQAVLNGENLMSVSGTWFNELEILPSPSELKPLTGLLVNYSSNDKKFSDIEIADITLGYSINEHGVYHKQSTVSPIYQVITTDGRVFYIDARGM